MRRALAVLPLLLGLVVAVLAQGREPIPFGQGLLFRVSAGGAPACHLFATIHSADAEVAMLVPEVRPVLEQADFFVMEVVPDAGGTLNAMLTMIQSDGRTLEDTIGPELYRRTVQAVEHRGLSESAIRDFKPWAVMALLSLPPSTGGEILDLQLYQLSRQLGKDVRGLETIREQLDIFDSLSEPDQVRLLRDTLAIQDELPEIFQRLLVTYLDQDLDGLMRLSDDYLQSEDDQVALRFQEQVVHRRNRHMVERIEPMLAEGGAFVAVGALHLPGDKGILALLAAKGYRVEPVTEWGK
jgi:uncharacterized protein YbaP (TraB family)